MSRTDVGGRATVSRAQDRDESGRGGRPLLSLADSLKLLLRDCSPDLVPLPERTRLCEAALGLPPLHRGGLECRLGDSVLSADLQQCVVGQHGEPFVTSRFLEKAAAGSGATSAQWQRIAHFCREWTVPPGAGNSRSIENIWLELDTATSTRRQDLSPSLFLALDRKTAGREAPLQTVLDTACALGGESIQSATAASLECCFEACPEGAGVSHVGVMQQREGCLRVNVQGLQPSQMTDYLGKVQWPGDTIRVGQLVSALQPEVDRFRLCLDLGAGLQATIGLECFVDSQERWDDVLLGLESRGLCTQEKRRGLLSWPGVVTPEDAGTWPFNLVVESRLHGMGHLGLFQKELSHVKVSMNADSALSAKGYLWFTHAWINPQGAEHP